MDRQNVQKANLQKEGLVILTSDQGHAREGMRSAMFFSLENWLTF